MAIRWVEFLQRHETVTRNIDVMTAVMEDLATVARKIEVKVFSIDELSPKAKARAIEDFRPHAWDQSDSDWLNDVFKERLDEIGLPTKKLAWSLSSSQGDGVGFYGPIDLGKLVNALSGVSTKKGPLEWSPRISKYKSLVEKVGVTLEPRSNRYHHWNNMDVTHEVYEDLAPDEEALLKDLLEDIDKKVKELSKDLEKIGYAMMESLQSDEVITELFQENGWEFLEDGKRWRQSR